MKRILLPLVAFLLFVVSHTLSAQDNYPLKPLASTISNYIQSVKKTPKYQNDKAYFRAYRNRRDSLMENLLGKEIHVVIKPGLGYELVSEKGQMGKGFYFMGKIETPINVDLKVKDANLALKNQSLYVFVYDNKGTIVHVGLLGKERNLTSHSVDEEMLVISDDDSQIKNPYKNGDVLHKGFNLMFDTFTAYRFVNVSKIVIAPPDYKLSQTVSKTNKDIVDSNRKTFKGSY